MSPLGEFISVSEASKLLRKHPRTVRRWIRSGSLQGWHVGGEMMTTRAALEAIVVPVEPVPPPPRQARTAQGAVDKWVQRELDECEREHFRSTTENSGRIDEAGNDGTPDKVEGSGKRVSGFEPPTFTLASTVNLREDARSAG